MALPLTVLLHCGTDAQQRDSSRGMADAQQRDSSRSGADAQQRDSYHSEPDAQQRDSSRRGDGRFLRLLAGGSIPAGRFQREGDLQLGIPDPGFVMGVEYTFPIAGARVGWSTSLQYIVFDTDPGLDEKYSTEPWLIRSLHTGLRLCGPVDRGIDMYLQLMVGWTGIYPGKTRYTGYGYGRTRTFDYLGTPGLRMEAGFIAPPFTLGASVHDCGTPTYTRHDVEIKHRTVLVLVLLGVMF